MHSTQINRLTHIIMYFHRCLHHCLHCPHVSLSHPFIFTGCNWFLLQYINNNIVLYLTCTFPLLPSIVTYLRFLLFYLFTSIITSLRLFLFMKINDEGSLFRQPVHMQETYLADVSIRCSNPPQGEMKLDWRDSALYRLSMLRTCGTLFSSS